MPALSLAEQTSLIEYAAHLVKEASQIGQCPSRRTRAQHDLLRVPTNLALDLPCRDSPVVELESSDTACRLNVSVLVIPHVLLNDGNDIVLPHHDRAIREREQSIDVI